MNLEKDNVRRTITSKCRKTGIKKPRLSGCRPTWFNNSIRDNFIMINRKIQDYLANLRARTCKNN